MLGKQLSEECQKPQPPLLLKKVSQYTSNLYCNTPPICIAVLPVPQRSEEREILSVLLPFVSQYASHLYCNTPPICIVVLLGKSWRLWSPGCSPNITWQLSAPPWSGCTSQKLQCWKLTSDVRLSSPFRVCAPFSSESVDH